MDPISGKHDKKSIVSAYCKNKMTICHDRTLLVFLLDLSWHVVGSSPRHGEHTAFFSGFPLGGIPRLTHFAGYPFGASRKKIAAVFYGTAFRFMADCCFFIFAGHDTDRAVSHPHLKIPHRTRSKHQGNGPSPAGQTPLWSPFLLLE